MLSCVFVKTSISTSSKRCHSLVSRCLVSTWTLERLVGWRFNSSEYQSVWFASVQSINKVSSVGVKQASTGQAELPLRICSIAIVFITPAVQRRSCLGTAVKGDCHYWLDLRCSDNASGWLVSSASFKRLIDTCFHSLIPFVMWVDYRVIEVFLDIHGFHECFECVVLASVFCSSKYYP